MTFSVLLVYVSIPNFNSHAHVERDRFRVFCLSFCKISTHTLTWSVTLNFPNGSKVIFISTHTLTWSVTYRRRELHQEAQHFNSHAHVERDFQPPYLRHILQISTHTLTWSVTEFFTFVLRKLGFQLTRSRGA